VVQKFPDVITGYSEAGNSIIEAKEREQVQKYFWEGRNRYELGSEKENS
jgi:hypothetical protein